MVVEYLDDLVNSRALSCLLLSGNELAEIREKLLIFHYNNKLTSLFSSTLSVVPAA